MPNPRAQKPLSFDQIIKDAKSLGVPAQALLDALAGGVKGSVSATAGAPSDIYNLLNQVSFRGQLPTMPYGSEDISKMLPDVVPTEDKSRKHSAEYGEFAGSFIPTPMAGQALKGAVKLGTKGARALGEGLGQLAPSGSGPQTLASQVGAIKLKGGNWFKDEVENNLLGLKQSDLLNNIKYYHGPEFEKAREARIKELKEYGNEGALRVAKILEESIEPDKAKGALNQWVDKNLTNYIKKEMGTPEDPVRLMIDRRVEEINRKHKEDMARADRVAQRATEETDPRRQANLQRESNRLKTEADSDLELGLKHVAHFNVADKEYFSPDDVTEIMGQIRQEAGFPAMGMGKSSQAKGYENYADEAFYSKKAGQIQEIPERLVQAEKAKVERIQAQEDLDKKVVQYLKDSPANLNEQQIKNLVRGMAYDEKERLIGDDTYSKAVAKHRNIGLFYDDDYNLKRLEENPFIKNLSPETNIYSAQTGNLEFSHILDVLKEDLASGRLKPEELKNISVEQAVRKTADYDLALAKKMQDAQAKKLEDMTVHKEYPEGMRWVQLDKPGQFASESEAMGHSVRGYEPPKSHPDWVEGSGDSGSSGYGLGGWEAIKSGKAKVYSLVDSKGNPHTTIEVGKGSHPIGTSGTGSNFPHELRYGEYDNNYLEIPKEKQKEIYDLGKKLHFENLDAYAENRILSGNKTPDPWDSFQKAADILVGERPGNISQIKGKSNLKPVDTYIPYVQDFVKSGNWSDVGDLHHTDLTKIYPESDLAKSLVQKGISVPSYTTSEELTNLLKQAEVGSYRDASKGKTWINDEHPDYRNEVPPIEGMKRGGAVHISDNPDTMYMELMDKKMKGGGSEDDTKLTPSQWLQAQANKPIEPFTPIEDLTANLKAIANLPSRMYEGAKQLVTDPRAYFADMKAPTAEELAMAFNPSSVGLAGMATKVGKLNAVDALFPNKTESMLNSAEKSALTKYKKDLDVPAVMRRELFRTTGTGDIETPSLKMRPEKGLNPDYLENKYVVPILWDTSGAGTNVSQIAGVPLSQGLRSSTPASVQKQGGRLYPLIEENAQQGVGGASMLPAASSKVNNLNTYSDKGPTVGVVMDMAEHGIDFSHHIAEPYIGMLNALRPSNDALKAFKEAIRKTPVINPITGAKVYPYTKFPGIDSPNIREIIAKGTDDYSAGNIRKAIAEVGDTYAMEKLGFPRWSDIYKTMSMPDAKTGQSAKTILEVNPKTQLITPNFEHGSYNTGMGATYAGGLADVNNNIVGVPDTVLLKRLFDERLAQGKTIGNVRSSLLKSHHGQLMTAEDIARLREYLGYDKPKKKAKGGTIKKAKGGEISEDDIQMEVRPL